MVVGIIDIVVLGTLFVVLGNYISKLLFGTINKLDIVQMKFGGIIFSQVLGLIFYVLGNSFENINIKLSLQLAGVILFVLTTYNYWNDLSNLYRFIILACGLSYFIYDATKKEAEVSIGRNVFDLAGYFVNKL